VKTDRTDAESLVRVLMALQRGEHQVAKIVKVPSPEDEDHKWLLRGLLNLQGVRHIHPNRPNWESALIKLQTADSRPFPQQLMNEIRREAKLLASVILARGRQKPIDPSPPTGCLRSESTRGAFSVLLIAIAILLFLGYSKTQ